MSINQILVACLVAILVVFLVYMGKLAISALGLLKDAKVLVKESKDAVNATKTLADECGDKVKETAQTLMDNATPVTKVAGLAAAGFAIANFGWLIRRRFLLGHGLLGGFVEHVSRKRAEKELIKTKKEVAKMRKMAKREARATRKAAKKMAKNIG